MTLKPVSVPLQHNRQAHNGQHRRLQPGVLGEQDRDIADKGHEADHAPYHVLFAVEVPLVRGVEIRVVGGVVVAFGEELERSRSVKIGNSALVD